MFYSRRRPSNGRNDAIGVRLELDWNVPSGFQVSVRVWDEPGPESASWLDWERGTPSGITFAWSLLFMVNCATYFCPSVEFSLMSGLVFTAVSYKWIGVYFSV